MVSSVPPDAKLQRVEREVPQSGPKELLVRVQACGVCHSDTITAEGMMPGIDYPRVPGHGVIGMVEAIGANVEGWKPGDRAGVGWFGGSCGYCDRCRRHEALACENVHAATGVTRDGGYATHMLADVSVAAHVPADMDAALRRLGGAQVILATVTSAEAMQSVVGGLGPNGTMMIIGAVPAFPVDPLDMIARSSALRGWYSGVATDSEDTLRFCQLHRISSMNEIYPFGEAQAAYDCMESGKARFRVVLKMT